MSSSTLYHVAVAVPAGDTIPAQSPEDNWWSLKIGAQCLQAAQQRPKDDTAAVQSLQRELAMERQLAQKMVDRLNEQFDIRVASYEKKIEALLVQLKDHDKDVDAVVRREVARIKEQCDLLLQEKEQQNARNRDVFEKLANKLASNNNNKSSTALGDDGEVLFEQLAAETFKDFAGFRLENKAKQGHQGDFHLYFDAFNVLVDCKNYSSNVQKKEVVKIEADLAANEHMQFAWMVSFHSNVCDYHRFPITVKWISTPNNSVKCILFLNQLLDQQKDPRHMLRQAWLLCHEFQRLTKEHGGEVDDLQEREIRQRKQVKTLQERCAEMRRHLNSCSNVVKALERDLVELLDCVTTQIVQDTTTDHKQQVSVWWSQKVGGQNPTAKVTSTELWNRFKRDHGGPPPGLTVELFKEILTSGALAPSNAWTEKTKGGCIEFHGYTLL